MTKAIWVLIIAVLAYVGYLLFLQWEKAQGERAQQGAGAATAAATGDSLPGMPPHLESTYRSAKERGATAFQTWFNTNEKQIADPRKAWIELELCVVMSRSNPAEARKIFANVKGRVPPSSPVWPRIKELEKTFE